MIKTEGKIKFRNKFGDKSGCRNKDNARGKQIKLARKYSLEECYTQCSRAGRYKCMNFKHTDGNDCYYYSGECAAFKLGNIDSNIYEAYIYEEDNILRDPNCPFRASSCTKASDGSLVALYEGQDIM